MGPGERRRDEKGWSRQVFNIYSILCKQRPRECFFSLFKWDRERDIETRRQGIESEATIIHMKINYIDLNANVYYMLAI